MKTFVAPVAAGLAIILTGCSTSAVLEDQKSEQAILPAFCEKLPWIEFIVDAPDRKVIGTLRFRINEVTQGVNSDLHTTYYGIATVLDSDVGSIRKGAMFVGLFDRWYSIFDSEGGMPFQKGDVLVVYVTGVDKNTVYALPKNRLKP